MDSINNENFGSKDSIDEENHGHEEGNLIENDSYDYGNYNLGHYPTSSFVYNETSYFNFHNDPSCLLPQSIYNQVL